MLIHKSLRTLMSALMIASLVLGATTPASARQIHAQGAQSSVVAGRTGSTPMDPMVVDETKVPHYFGPWPNWANSPFTLPNAAVEIQGDGTGATAVANVNPVTQGIDSIDITSPGSGYTYANVVISGGNNDAAATAAVNLSGVVTAVEISDPGAGYTAPQVTFADGGASTQATGIAYGGVYEVIVTDPGSNYTVPTVEFDLPDAPDGVQARGHIASTALGDPFNGMVGGQILPNGIIVDEPGSGYLIPPGVAIHDGTLFDPQVGATLATATATLMITSVSLVDFGSGYTSAPTVTFSDPNPSVIPAAATALVDVGGVTSITVDNAGTGYLTVGMRKFIDDLPGLCTPPACPSYTTNPTAKYIPLAIPEAKNYNGIEADEFVIGLVQYRTSFSSDLPSTLVRGYVQLETQANAGISQHYPLKNELLDGTQVSTGYFAVTPPQWLGPVIAATKNKPVRIVFRNLLPTGAHGDLFLPVDASMMGSGMGPMDMPMAPMDGNSVDDEVRNPTCTVDPQAQHWDAAMGMMMDSCFKNNRATLHLHGGITPWISDGTAHQWITPAGEMASWPQGVSVSEVPDMNVCAANDDGCQTFYYTNQQSARLLFYHDHSWGITRLNVYAGEAAGYLISDETEAALLASSTIPADQIPLIVQDRTFVPDAAQLALQDPTWDSAKWGTKGNFWYHHVYMPAQNPGDPGGMSAYGRWMYGPWFWPPAADTKYGPIPNPYYDPNCSLDDPGTWQYDTDPFCEPQEIPGTPNISAGMEQFNDTPIVNGVAYPKVTLEPKSYRFRVLNAANDRFFNFQWYVADPTQGNGLTEVALNPAELEAAQTDPVVFPTPVHNAATNGPDWIQIGTEGGFLPAPVVIDGQQHTTWIGDPTVFNVGNVDQHSLLLAPAERADVIVDFSQFAGKTLILYNDAPAAFPARIPSYDYYTGAPDLSPVGAPTILPGYGPNTRTIMQVTIAGTVAPAFNLTKLQNAFKHNSNGTGVFESGQHPIIVGQAAYNSAYGTSFPASSNCNAPGSSQQRCDGFVRVSDTMSFGFNTLRAPTVKLTLPLQPKAIHDETNSTTFDEYGRMQANLGVEAQPPTPGLQNVTLYPFVNPATELIDATNLPKADVVYDGNGLPVNDVKITPIGDAGDGTQIWRVTHNGVDTHPIHFHLYDVQLINRVSWDNIIAAPDGNELGWKDTVRIAPLEDTIVALRPVIPELPFEIPNAVRKLNPMMGENSEEMFSNIDPQGRPLLTPIVNQLVNFGWEYVYHCHILSHEEMDMMRPVSVALPPIKATWADPASVVDGSGLTLNWNDNSITETAFVIQRMDADHVWENLVTIESPIDPEIQPNVHEQRSYTDTTYVDGSSYKYRIVAQNTVGYLDGTDPTVPGFPELTVQSISDILSVGPGMPPEVVSILRASPNPSSAPSVDFTVTFSEDVTGVDTADFTPLSTGTISGPSVTAVSGTGATYTVSVSTGTGAGTLGLALVDNDTIINGTSVPLGGAGLVNGDFTAGQTYTIDYTPPAVTSIGRLNTNPTALTSVNFRVNFTETVTGVDAADFALTATGLTGSSIASVTGTGATRTVRVNTGTGSGTIRLNVIDNDTIKDVLFVPLGGTGAGNGNFTTGQVYSIDRQPPSVASIVRLDTNPALNGAVNFRVAFSESVTGVDLADFGLTATGSLASPSLTSVTGTGSIYMVAVDTGPGAGTLRLDVTDNDTIKDAMNYPLGGVGAGNGSFTAGEVYDVGLPPTVVSIALASANPTNAASVDYTVTFSEAVSGVDTTDFALNATGITGASVTGVNPVSTSVYTITVGTGTGSGTLRLDVLDDDSIIDSSSTPLGGAGAGNGAYSAGPSYDIDKTVPTVSIVAASANPSGAASVDYTVTFSEPVTGVAANDFALFLTGITGASVTSVNPVSATVYTVAVDTGNGNGTLRLDIPGTATIADLAGNSPVLPFTGGEIYTIEKIPPTVASIALASANPTNAASVDFTVTFSEAVSGVDAADFSLNLVGITGASVTGVNPVSTSVYTVTVNTGTGSGTIRLDVVDNDSILNGFSVPLGGTGAGNGAYNAGPSYNIDKTAPIIQSIVRTSATTLTNAASVQFTVTFSEAVTGVAAADFAPVVTGISGASATGVSGSQATYTVTVNTGSGDGTLSLDVSGMVSIADPAGNALGASQYTPQAYDIDKTAPTIQSIVRASANPTNAASVQFTVTFSESVAGVDLADFVLTPTGVSGATLTGFNQPNPNQPVYTVVVNTGSGDGTLSLDTSGTVSIADPAGNALGTSQYTPQVYDIDKTAPTIQSIVRTSATNPTDAVSVDYTVTFSEKVTGVQMADFAVSATGSLAGYSITGLNQPDLNQPVYTVTVDSGDGTGQGTLLLDMAASPTIADLAGNPISNQPPNTQETYSIFIILNSGKFDDMDAAWRYTGNWTVASQSGPYSNTIHYTNVQNAGASLTFDGTRFTVYFAKYPNRGTVEVWIDGGVNGAPQYTFSEYGTALAWQQSWTLPVSLSPGVHTVEFRKVGASTTTYIDIDSITITGPVTLGTHDDTNLNWMYVGNWTVASETGPYNNTYHYTNVQNAGASLTFDGTRFTVYFAKYPNRGTVEVWIDGGVNGAPQYTFSEYGTALAWQQSWTLPVSLSPGVHTVEFRKVGASTTTYIDIDSIRVFNPDAISPAAISDLAAVTGTNHREINLSWTAVGNDGMSGVATSYLVRYSSSPIATEQDWNNATPFANSLVPKPAGGSESLTVTGLFSTAPYYFAVRAQDDQLNLGGLLNSPSATANQPAAVVPGTYDDMDAAWRYTGNWTVASQSGPYSNTIHYTNVQNAGASLTFDGTRFTVYFAKYPNRGTVEVWIDGGVNGAPQYTFSEYGTALAWQQSWTLPVSLSPGVHTVEFRKVGASTTTYIDIDSIVIP